MWSLLLPMAKGVVMQQLNTLKVKTLVIEILQAIVKETDNDLDDIVVLKLKQALLSPIGTPISKQ